MMFTTSKAVFCGLIYKNYWIPFMYRKHITKTQKKTAVGLIYYYRLLELIAFITKKSGYFTNNDCQAHLKSLDIDVHIRTIQRMTQRMTALGVLKTKQEKRLVREKAEFICIKDFDYESVGIENKEDKSIYSLCLIMRIFEHESLTSKEICEIYKELDKKITVRTAQRYLKGLYDLKVLCRRRAVVKYYYAISDTFYSRVEHLVKNKKGRD